MASTTHEALLAELLGDVGLLHDQIKALPDAISDAVAGATAKLERCAEAQTYWIEQETLKDRAAFLAQQKEQADAAHNAMAALIAVQNSALESVLVRIGGLTAELVRKEVKAAVVDAINQTRREPPQTAFVGPARWAMAAALAFLFVSIGAWLGVIACQAIRP